MDETTEPIIVVIGHPIAGNPTQFALETGFQAAQIDCRVLSVDLPEPKLAVALAGMDAMRFRAVWVAPSCRLRPAPPPQGSEALQSSGSEPISFFLDLLVHDANASPSDSWSPRSMKHQVWQELAERRMEMRDASCRWLTWIDPRADLSSDAEMRQRQSLLDVVQAVENGRYENLTLEHIHLVNRIDQIPSLDRSDETSKTIHLIVFAGCNIPPPSNWTLPADSLTIDINENWETDYLIAWDRLKSSVAEDPRRDCIRGIDVHAACLSRMTYTIFGQKVSSDIFLEAVDEYLAV